MPVPEWLRRKRELAGAPPPQRRKASKATRDLGALRKKVEREMVEVKAPDGKSAGTGMEVEARLEALRDDE